MGVDYDKYYQTEDLFGAPYPELINFYSNIKQKGSLLDVGCGQGRDALALARMGFDVTAIDHSEVGIQDAGNKVDMLNAIANEHPRLRQTHSQDFVYVYEDRESGHSSEMPYRMISFQKNGQG